eukprot:6467362-Amphidinium_carterae.1
MGLPLELAPCARYGEHGAEGDTAFEGLRMQSLQCGHCHPCVALIVEATLLDQQKTKQTRAKA